MQQIQTDVLELTRNLLLGKKTKTKNSLHLQRYSDSFFCSVSLRLMQNMHTHTRTHRAYLVTLQCSSSSQGLLTDLAYFLEVELWQGMEPVGQLSEVEKLHLKPESEIQTEVKWEKERRGKKQRVEYCECNLRCCHSDKFSLILFVFLTMLTVKKKASGLN